MARLQTQLASSIPIPDELRLAHERGELIVCVGPELHAEARLSSAASLALELVDSLDQSGDRDPKGDPARLRAWVAQGRVSESLELLERQLGPRFQRFVERYWSDHGHPIPELAREIAGLRPQLRAVYSTGLGHALERAFEDEWPSFSTPRSDVAQRSKIIFKLCGALESPETWVVTRAAFEREFGERSLRRQVFAAACQAHCLLFIAFDPGDELFNWLTAPINVSEALQRPMHFFVGSRCEREQRLLLEARGIRVIIADPGAVLRTLGKSAEPSTTASTELPDCPYPGLQAFGREHAKVFHGRRAEVSRAAARLGGPRSRHRRWLAIEGPSGVGKSSFVRAGLVPALCRGFAEATPARMLVVDLRPGPRPFDSLATALARSLQFEAPPDEVAGLVEAVRRGAPIDAGLLLVVDQLEELVTLADPSERASFCESIAKLLEAELIYLLTTLRVDFVTTLSIAQPDFSRLINDRAERYTLAPISRVGLRAAIAEPAAQFGVAFEPELVERIASDAEDHLAQIGTDDVVRTSDAGLPLVAHLLEGLWQGRAHGSGPVTLADYKALGGVSGALSRSADSVIAALDHDQLERAKALLLGLVKLDSSGRDTRRTLTYHRALALAGGGDEGQRLLLLLSGGAGPRLLVVRGEGETQAVDLVHEALLREWETLSGWIAQDHVQLTRDEALARRAASWANQDRPWQSLPRGRERRELLRGRPHGDDTGIQHEFQRAMKRAAWVRVSAWSSFAALTLIIGLGVTELLRTKSREVEAAEHQLRDSNRAIEHEQAQARGAEAARDRTKRAIEIQDLLNTKRHYAALSLVLEADPSEDPVARTQLQTAINNPAIVGELARYTNNHTKLLTLVHDPNGRFVVGARADGSVERWDLSTLEVVEAVEAGSAIHHIRFSPDGALMAYGRDGTTWLWSTQTGERLATPFPGNRAEFSPDGRLLAAHNGRSVALYEVASGHQRWLNSDGNSVKAIAFIPGADLLASASTTGAVSLWSVDSGEAHATLVGSGTIRDLAASPDGRYLASSGDDNNTRWWTVADAKLVAAVPAKVDPLAHFVRFSPDGRKLATHARPTTISVTAPDDPRLRYEFECNDDRFRFSADGRWLLVANPNADATLLDANTGEAVAHIQVDGEVHALTFLPDSERFAIASANGAVSLWEIDSTTGWTDPWTHPLMVRALTFAPTDPNTLASASADGVRVWQLGGPGEAPVLRHDARVSALRFSTDQQLAALSRTGSIRWWDTHTQAPLETVAGACEAGPSDLAAISGDSRVGASVCDGAIRLVDLRTGELLAQVTPAGPISALALTHDGPRLLVGGQGGSIELFVEGQLVRSAAGHEGAVKSIAIAERAGILVSGGNDDRVQIWDIETLERREVINSRTGKIGAVAISSDGEWIAAAGQRGEVTLYSATGSQIAVFNGHTSRVSALGFSADDSLLASGSSDRTVRLWPISLDAQLRLGCQRLQRFPAHRDQALAACAIEQ